MEKRLKAHNEGKAGAKYTRAKRPVELVYYEGYATKEEAMSREYAIKQLTRKEKLALMDFEREIILIIRKNFTLRKIPCR